jgi:hypothetical protein
MQFSVPSGADGTVLYGQVDGPAGQPTAIVFLVQGTGPPTRDYVLKAAGVEPYAAFADLSSRLTARGFSVIRYDMRGFSCAKPGARRDKDGLCHDAQESLTTSYSTKPADILAVAQFAIKQPGGSCLIVMPHSEGNHHMGRLINNGSLTPHGYVGLGAPLQAWATLFRWQSIDMLVRSIRQADVDRDGITSDAEINKAIPRTAASHLLVAGKLTHPRLDKPLTTPAAGWTSDNLIELRKTLADRYELYRQELMAKADDAPMGKRGHAKASWAKALTSSWVPDAWLLHDYRGYLSFHQGDRDFAIDEVAAAHSLAEFGPPAAKYRLYKGLNHFFGPEGFVGPAEGSALDAIVADVHAAAASCMGPGKKK